MEQLTPPELQLLMRVLDAYINLPDHEAIDMRPEGELLNKLDRMHQQASEEAMTSGPSYPGDYDPLDEQVPGYPPQEPRESGKKTFANMSYDERKAYPRSLDEDYPDHTLLSTRYAPYPDDAFTRATEIPVGDEQLPPDASETYPAWNIYWYEREEHGNDDDEGEFIDQTQVDEDPSEDGTLVWELFQEFGHTRTPNTYYTWEEVTGE
jgi:hypothetical protein